MRRPMPHLLVSQTGGPLRPRTLETAWRRARINANLPGTRFHDLRHSHLTLFATTGATRTELMSRAGHSSPRAALVYQHATQDRDRVLADALSGLATPMKLVHDDEKTRSLRAQIAPERQDDRQVTCPDQHFCAPGRSQPATWWVETTEG